MRAPRSLVALGTPLALALVGASSCGDAIEVPMDQTSSAASGIAGGPPSTSSVVGGGGPGQGGGGEGAGDGGGLPQVWVGVVANPTRDGTDKPTRVDEVEAAASTFAIGATAFATKRSLSTATLDGFTQDAQLAGAGCASVPGCRPVALTIAIVDGFVDGRPPLLQGEPWGSAASRAAVDDSIDAAMEALGPALRFLSIGARVDRWIEQHEEDADDLDALLASAVERALDHPDARPDLLVGVGLSRDGALSTSAPLTSLRAIGNATMASLLPGLSTIDSGAPIPSPGSIALDLDAIDDVEPGRPVVLVEVGYPSAEEVGATDEAQGLFFDALFGALASRRASFPLVVVSRLHDLDPEACAEEGIEVGEAEELVLAYRCSTGIRSEIDEPKPAWARFVVGAATLASGSGAVNP